MRLLLFCLLTLSFVFARGQTAEDTLSGLEVLWRESQAKKEQYKIEHPIVRNHLTVSVNIIQIPINEIGVYVDYFFCGKHSIEFNIGKIYANEGLKLNLLAGDQGNYPGTVWNGIVGRINYKNYFTDNKRKYFAIQVVYKNLYYRNQSFANNQGDNTNTFVRSEDAYLVGIDFMLGYRIGKPDMKINLELFGGIGLRYRERNYTTLSSHANYYQNPKPLGSFVLDQTYPTFILGFKVGFKSFFGKKTKA